MDRPRSIRNSPVQVLRWAELAEAPVVEVEEEQGDKEELLAMPRRM